MANDQSSHLGLRPLREIDRADIMYFRANTAQAIYRWHPAALNNSGQLIMAAPGDNVQIIGTIVGFLDANKAALPLSMDSLSDGPYLSASDDAQVAVCVNPDMFYTLEADTGGSSTVALTDIGTTAGFTYIQTTGNTTTGIANVVLDASDIAADSGGTFRIVGLLDNINQDGTLNTPSANFAKVIVKIHHYQLGQGSLSAAV